MTVKDRFQLLKKTLKHIKARSLFFGFVVLLITAVIAFYAGFQIHTMKNETLLLQGEINTQEAAMEYNRYLLTRVDIVTMVANTVEDLIENGSDSSMIEKYLTDSTNNVIETLDPSTTGIYGLFNGEYLDGAGWVPDADYVPTERPWYVQTINSDRKITFVEPYLDAQTKTIMMTVSTLLSDGESVLAMDVSLTPIQDIIERVSASTAGSQAFLIDADGVVIAHSDESQLGKNYLRESESLGGIIAHRVIDDGQRHFEVDTADGKYVVYVDDLEGGWYSVSLINGDVWHRPLHRTMLIFSIIFVLVILSIVDFFLRLTAKNIALQELHNQVDEEQKRGNKLQALSETDRMTGLYDRVSGERRIADLIASGNGGMFLELDIDHFKEINDTCGHQTGDTVILAITNALRSTFRANDVIMRLGGDEFGVFAVGIVNQEMGAHIIQRLFARVDHLDVPEMNGEKVCISVGAVLTPDDKALSFHELYGIADDALYTSKKAPGNFLTFGESK